MPTITWEDFTKVELRIGTKRSSAQLTALYTPDELVGRRVLAVMNFPPRRIAGFLSGVLVTGVRRSDGAVVLVDPDRPVENGCALL